ncbi:LOW QUALITY PROTEIN: carcinoembryonic antigen-related cell adhesion molecule 3-like [Peromyscus leucopus]|uniref:LOW QUALITY PROTEIN: carcinoembryonic antigen-related cell adhesion molecule 3-like n=1 Tax=Peromyscus leucopus TaxID=10041 RepID=UPI0010A114EA|nr:LOW QUALITY PROTEIN: carcinoembryonic antigen-related cell adhesion molecule 3-like [Peromyscus leucopus]
MEVYSVMPCKGCTPWQGLLLTASLFTCCHLSTTAQVTIESVPPQVVEGENVLLRVHNLPENLLAFIWHKGARNMSLRIALYSLAKDTCVKGPVHSGRETVYSNGSLQIHNVTQKDIGFYTLRTINRRIGIASITTKYLHVYTSLVDCGHHLTSAQPTIESVPPSVAEGSSVLLLVHNLPQNLLAFFWYKGMVVFNNLEISRHVIFTNSSMLGPAHSGRETVYNNGSLLLQNVTSKDTGLYTLRTVATDLKAEVLHVQVQVDTFSLTYGCPPSYAQPTVESVPPRVAEGASVLLMAHHLPENLLAFLWYKGVIVLKNHEIARHIIAKNSSVLGPAHSGRETVYSNGSLLLQDVTWKDTGLYTLRTLSTDLKKGLVYVQLLVDTSLSTCCNPLMIEPVPWNAAVGESVLFLVHNLPEDVRTFSWYKGVSSFQMFKMAEYNRTMNSITPGPAHSRRAMVCTNGSLLLQDVTEEDAGFYTLQTLNRNLKTETTHVQLHVNPCRNAITTAKLTVESVPPNVVEGENILLFVHNIPENLRAFSWYKGVTIVNSRAIAWYSVPTNRSLLGPAHSGRETVYPNGSLLLHNATQKDTGFYTLRTLNIQLETQETRRHIHVYKPVSEPFLGVSDTTVPVQSSVLFTCLSANTGISIRWIFNNQSLHLTERMTLSPTKCRLSIDPVRREDAGEYQCEVSNPVSSKTSLPVRLAIMNE